MVTSNRSLHYHTETRHTINTRNPPNKQLKLTQRIPEMFLMIPHMDRHPRRMCIILPPLQIRPRQLSHISRLTRVPRFNNLLTLPKRTGSSRKRNQRHRRVSDLGFDRAELGGERGGLGGGGGAGAEGLLVVDFEGTVAERTARGELEGETVGCEGETVIVLVCANQKPLARSTVFCHHA